MKKQPGRANQLAQQITRRSPPGGFLFLLGEPGLVKIVRAKKGPPLGLSELKDCSTMACG